MTRPLGAIAVLSAAGLAIVIAPAVVPDYHWVSQSVSETAAQNTPGAWVGRIAFPLLAIGVALLLPGVHWGAVSRAWYGVFVAGLLAVGVWSHEPYLAGVTFDELEANLHSIAATAMGVAVVNAELFAAWHTRVWSRLLLAASYLGLPIAMTAHPAWAGVYQRLLFGLLIATFLVHASRQWVGMMEVRGREGEHGHV